MKSRITIEVDFDQNSPFIKVLEHSSDDVRDGLVKAFRQSLGDLSSWAKIKFFQPISSDGIPENHQLYIYPIRAEHVESEIKDMKDVIKLLKLEEVSIDQIPD